MRRRPWPILILAIGQLFVPLFHILINSWLQEISPLRLTQMILLFYPARYLFEFFCLPLIAALSLYAMKKMELPAFSHDLHVGALSKYPRLVFVP